LARASAGIATTVTAASAMPTMLGSGLSAAIRVRVASTAT
jgi:hypothetical protein